MEPPWKTRIMEEKRGRAGHKKWKKCALVKETRTGPQHLSYLSSMPLNSIQCQADYPDDSLLRKECLWRKPRLLVSSLLYHLRRFRDYEPSSGTRTPEWGLAIGTLCPPPADAELPTDPFTRPQGKTTPVTTFINISVKAGVSRHIRRASSMRKK